MEVRQKYACIHCSVEWTLIWESDKYKNQTPPEPGDFPAFLACHGGCGDKMYPMTAPKFVGPHTLRELIEIYFLRRDISIFVSGKWQPRRETITVTHEGFSNILKDEAWSIPNGPDIQQLVGTKKPRFWGMKINIID